MLYLIAGWITGYVWCSIWRLGRPAKAGMLSLIAGWWLGRHEHDRHR